MTYAALGVDAVGAPQDCLDAADRSVLEPYLDPDRPKTPPEPYYSKYRQRLVPAILSLPLCAKKEMPRAPSAPSTRKTCVSQLEAVFVAQCLANPGHPDCQAFASNPANLAYLAMPACPDQVQEPLPDCLSAEGRALLTYCDQYGVAGPEPTKNALCYTSKVLNPQRYARAKALPACPLGERPARTREPKAPSEGPRDARIRVPRTVYKEPGSELSTMSAQTVQENTRRGNLRTAGIIAAVVIAAGAGGYAYYRKRKKG